MSQSHGMYCKDFFSKDVHLHSGIFMPKVVQHGCWMLQSWFVAQASHPTF